MQQTVIGEYNGHTNKPTWIIALWIDNDAALYDMALSMTRKARSIRHLEDDLKAFVEELIAEEYDAATMTMDLLNWAASFVDYRDLAESYTRTLEEIDAAEVEE